MSPQFSEDQQADPIEQLLYSCFHARKSLDRIDDAIWAQMPKPRQPTPSERNQIRNKSETLESLRLLDPLFSTPYGRSLHDTQYSIRSQLSTIARQYVNLGIEERRTRSIEQWASVLLPLFDAIATDPSIGLTNHQRNMLPSVVEHHLKVIEGGVSMGGIESAVGMIERADTQPLSKVSTSRLKKQRAAGNQP